MDRTRLYSDYSGKSVISLVILFMAATSHGTAADPLDRPAPDRIPEFRELVKAEDYLKRTATFSTQLEEARKLAKTKYPIAGMRVISVRENSPGQSQGLRVGDVVLKIDDEPVAYGIRVEGTHKLEYFSIASGRIKSAILPEVNGLRLVEHWRPEIAYLAQSKGSNWDQDAYVGFVAAEIDPDLAETAWYHAVKKGYVPDHLAALSGVQFAMTQGRPEVAWAFARFSREPGKEPAETLNPILHFRVAAANCDLPEMLRLVDDNPRLFQVSRDYLKRLIEMHRRRPLELREQRSPHEIATKLYKDDLLPRLGASHQNGIRSQLPALQRREPIVLKGVGVNQQLQQQQDLILTPPEPTPNVEISVKFTWHTDEGDDIYFRQFEVGLIDIRGRTGVPERYLTGCSLHERGINLHLPHLVRYADQSIKQSPQTVHEVKIIRVEGQVEFFFDGQRVLYLPVDTNATEVGLCLRAISSQATVQELKFYELIETQPDAVQR